MEKKLTDKEEQLNFRVNDEPPPEEKEKERILIHQIACNIRDGTADPKDAKHLMELFCDYADKEVQGRKQDLGCPPDKQIPKELLWHFRDAFKAILKGETLESALGIVGRRGRATKHKYHVDVATEYLKLVIKGMRAVDIETKLKWKLNLEKSAIQGIFKKYKAQALMQLRIEREETNPMRLSSPDIHFKREEEKRFYKLFPWKAKDEKRREENRNPTLSESQQQLKYAKAQEKKQLEENRIHMRNTKTRTNRKTRPKAG